MNFAENIVSNPVLIRLRREEESLGNLEASQSDKRRLTSIVICSPANQNKGDQSHLFSSQSEQRRSSHLFSSQS